MTYKPSHYEKGKYFLIRDIHYESSVARHKRLQGNKWLDPDCTEETVVDNINTEEDVKHWLGDVEGDLAIFRTKDDTNDVLITVATGQCHL